MVCMSGVRTQGLKPRTRAALTGPAFGLLCGQGFDEVEETAEVLWEFHDLLYTIFDYYGAMGASDDITHMTMNAFSMFVGDCQLSDKHSQYCKPTAFDQLFISVDASGAGKDTGEKFNRKKVCDATNASRSGDPGDTAYSTL